MNNDTDDWPDAVHDGEDVDAELTQATLVYCPYCGESVELIVDPAGGATQEYVEDCEVCCRPWAVRIAVDHDGQPTASVTTLDDE